METDASQNQKKVRRVGENDNFWPLIFLLSIAWWLFAGQGWLLRTILLVAVSLASFVVGCAAGFLFSSYGEESSTVGKIRDWLIGGITGLGIAEAIEQGGTLKRILLTFSVGPGPTEFGLVVGMTILYLALGFFFMFFQRELILNILLAQKRAERGKLDGTKQTSLIVGRMLNQLPPSVLSGVDDVDEIISREKANAKEIEKWRAMLYSQDVRTFLDQADQAAKDGGQLDWDIVSKAAYVHYYRSYFEKDEEKSVQVRRALEWITRALIMNPLHADLTLKYADMLGMDDDYEVAVEVLERLVLHPEAPMITKQWLGYFLLYVPDRIQDAIKYSEEYLQIFPQDGDAPFNIACAYAQMYCEEIRSQKKVTHSASAHRAKALEKLAAALTRDPDYAEIVRTKWTEKGESFECLASDKDFLALFKSPEEAARG